MERLPADRTSAISIHVLHVEDDAPPAAGFFQHAISIHVLHVEDDSCGPTLLEAARLFQSTSSMWRTTAEDGTAAVAAIFQSTSSMWRTT